MFRAILIACLLAASSASAFVVDRDRHGGGATYTLCSAETTSDAVCDDGTNDRAAVVLGFTELTFDSTESTATSYTCDIYAGNVTEVEAGANDLAAASVASAQINSISLSQNVEMIQFDGAFALVWIKCGTITGGNVTIKVQGAK
jgi:hypothetical protein